MKWKTHKKITMAICRALNLPRRVVDASTLPDQHREFTTLPNGKHVRIAHHSRMALRAAWQHTKNARRLLIQEEDYSEELGMALHYIQDYVVDPTRGIFVFKWRSNSAHDMREEELVNLPVDEWAIFEGMEICDPNTLKKFLSTIKRERDPEKIMHTATMASAAIARTLVDPVRKGYSWPTALAMHIFFLAIPLVLGLSSPIYLPASFALAYLVHKIDPIYHRARLENEWFR